MAVQTSLPALLDTLTQSLTSAVEAAPKIAGIEPTDDGVSLLDVKNELLLSYLQNLVFLILLKIRNAKASGARSDSGSAAGEDAASDLSGTVVKKLVELRLYLDKGVRPLEEKLRFQLDKILRAAEDADRHEQAALEAKEAESDSESSDDDDESEEEEEEEGPARNLSAKQFAPTFSTFTQSAAPVGMAAAAASGQDKTGVYRPPKIAPTVMPTTERRAERAERRPMKSATMDEFVSHELSAAPLAQPSVGTTIVSGGRKVKTAAERADEDRRREYEESNFVRLPKESKKDRAKRNRLEGRAAKMTFGGEDWRDLGEGVDRIERLTRRKEGGGGGGGGGTKTLLEKSRKRGRETTDSNRGSGFSGGTREIGERFNKKLKVMEGGRRDRGKR
ncbi:hypothetical protein F4775DRAFT_560344 [Biscogniauxia sp. FL1348]|nr:hypothetical protein F4775DRAFT_560344 [Biscogniauxia sp. FL1348]